MNEHCEQSSTVLFNQGKKLYIIGDYGKALECLIKACKARELLLGHLHADMFEPYFYLAKSYYMYSKSETELIGEGLEKGDLDAENDKEKDENPVEVVKVLKTIEEKTEPESINDKNENCEQIVEKSEIEAKESEEKENLSYLQLAYETMESAKLILSKQINGNECGNEKHELLLADCCDLVGNIYMEEGVMEESAKEFQKALEYRQKHLNPDIDRTIAESYFNLGNVYSSDLRMTEAVDAYEKCRSILMSNVGSDLADIIADLDERINDCKEGAKDYQLAKESIKQFLAVTAAGSPANAANDVTHLIRRRPKSDEQQGEQGKGGEPPVSKRRLE